MPSFGCSFPGCDRHPAKGDTILRVSKEGLPFVGACVGHYGEGGPEQAAAAEEGRRFIFERWRTSSRTSTTMLIELALLGFGAVALGALVLLWLLHRWDPPPEDCDECGGSPWV